MLTGEFRVTLDDKGRILIPSKLRASLDGDSLYVTRGLDNCLWLMLPSEFEKLAKVISPGPGSMFSTARRKLQRMIVSPAQPCDIDRSGRINVPPSLRLHAGLDAKSECILLGDDNRLELWNPDRYEAYLNEAIENGDFEKAAAEIGEQLDALSLGGGV